MSLLARMYFITILGLGTSTSGASPLVKIVDQFEYDDKKDAHEQLPIHRKAFLGKETRKKLIAALALGKHYFERRQFRVSLQFFATAESLTKADDPITSTLLYYRAAIDFEFGAFEQAKRRCRMLLRRKPSEEIRQKTYYITLMSTYKQEDFSGYVREFRRYEAQFPKRKQHPDLVAGLARAYKQLGQRQKEIIRLEQLSQSFPLSENSLWAFEQLSAYVSMNEYAYRKSWLKKLAINRDFEQSVATFLTEQADQPLSIDRRVKRLSILEKAEYFLELNLFEPALRMVKQLIESPTPKDKTASTSAIIARIFAANDDLENAQIHYIAAISAEKNHLRRYKLRSALASTYMKSREFDKANELYGKLATQRPNNNLRWDFFWSLYRSEEYEKALALLERPRYLRPKDPQEPLDIKYWRARLLERLGQPETARELYSAILNSDATSYYAALSLSRAPDLWESATVSPRELSSVEKTGVKLATTDPSFLISGLQTVSDLKQAGLIREAKIELRSLPLRDYSKTKETSTYVGSLAAELNDYHVSRRLMQASLAEFRQAGRGIVELREHQAANKREWATIFPIAYDKYVDPITESLNLNKLLVLSIMRAESQYNTYAQSWVGARGLMQIMPKTFIKIGREIGASDLEAQDLYKPAVNVAYGSYYIDKLLRYYDENPMLAIAAYNAGPIAANRWLKHCNECEVDEFVESIRYRETRRYVKKVIKNLGQYSRIYREDQPFWSLPNLPETLPSSIELY